MKLIADWKYVLRRAWSVRIAMLIALLSAIETSVQYYVDGQPSLIVIGNLILSLCIAVARVLDQSSLYDSYNNAP